VSAFGVLRRWSRRKTRPVGAPWAAHGGLTVHPDRLNPRRQLPALASRVLRGSVGQDHDVGRKPPERAPACLKLVISHGSVLFRLHAGLSRRATPGLFLDLAYDEGPRWLRSIVDLHEAIVHGAVKRLRLRTMTVAAVTIGLIP
jgi:hypothetical protein